VITCCVCGRKVSKRSTELLQWRMFGWLGFWELACPRHYPVGETESERTAEAHRRVLIILTRRELMRKH
jgi:hypothetical protein